MQAILQGVFLILGLILASGLLVMSQYAIESASKSQLREWSSRGDRAAGVALRFSEDPRRLLWTVRAWTTVLFSLAGVYAGASLVPRMSEAVAGFGILAPYQTGIGLGIVAIALSIISLVLSDLVPRRIALVRPERIAKLISWPVRALALVAVPVVGTLNGVTDLVLRAFGIRPAQEPPVTQEEISVLLQEGTKAGVLEEGEHELIKRVFRFSDRRARALDDASQ